MRVLHVHTTYRERGGEDVVVETERKMLADAGVDVAPVDARNPSGAAAAFAALATASWNHHAGRRVLALARRAQADVVHLHNTWFALTAAVPAVLSGAGYPVVATLHNYRLVCSNGLLFRDGRHCEDCLLDRSWPGVLHACYRGSRSQSALAAVPIMLHRRLGTWVHSVDRFLTLTPSAHDIFVRAGMPASRLCLRPNVVPDPGPRVRPPSDSDTVLFVGRLAAEKGLSTLLEAWRVAQPDGLRLEVVGDGPERHLEENAPSGVSFAGRLDATGVRQRMLSARALVVPSRYAETFGLVAVEGMAAGLPVLVSDVGDLPLLTGLDGTPHVLPPGDVTAWAAAITDLSSATSLDAAGSFNRQRYEAQYAPAGAAEALQQVYREVVAERASRAGAPPGEGPAHHRAA